MTGLFRVDALGPGGAYRTRACVTLHDVRGQPAAQMSVVPRVFIHRSLSALRAAGSMTADDRTAALARAGRAFAHGTVHDLPAPDYQLLVSRVSGLPVATVRAAAQTVADAAAGAYRSAQRARPEGATADWTDPVTRAGSAVWTRRGDVLAVHAAGNHPAVHALWLEAVALGYRVAVRPSAREPFTPDRLVTALREAGFGHDQVMLLPADHSGATDLIQGADLSVVYGGDAVVRKYGPAGNVLAQGPGRSKILLAGGSGLDHLETVVESVVHGGGTGCVNATAVFTEGDPARVAEALADRLSVLPSLPPEDDKAVLPVQAGAGARAIEDFLRAQAAGAVAHLGGEHIAEELGDNSAVLRPAVFEVDRADAPQIRVELPFPCVWVAPWSRADGTAPLRDTLVLTAIGCDDALLDELISEPTISNVYVGDHPTSWFGPGLPHDGYLGEFLMRAKTVIRG